MNTFSMLIVLALTLGFTSTVDHGITGKWRMHKVIQNGQDVTSEHNPDNDRYLILRADSTFESGGKPFGKNTGKYDFNKDDHRLLLDSDSGPQDDSYWIVSISNDTMYWQGYGSEWANNFQIIQVKSKE